MRLRSQLQRSLGTQTLVLSALREASLQSVADVHERLEDSGNWSGTLSTVRNALTGLVATGKAERIELRNRQHALFRVAVDGPPLTLFECDECGAVFQLTGELVDVPQTLEGHEVGSVLVTGSCRICRLEKDETADD